MTEIYTLDKIIEVELGCDKAWLDYDRLEDEYYFHYTGAIDINNVIRLEKKEAKKVKRFLESLKKGKVKLVPYTLAHKIVLDYVLSNYEDPLPKLEKLAKKSNYISEYLSKEYGIYIQPKKKGNSYERLLESTGTLIRALSHPMTLGLLTLGSFILDYFY